MGGGSRGLGMSSGGGRREEVQEQGKQESRHEGAWQIPPSHPCRSSVEPKFPGRGLGLAHVGLASGWGLGYVQAAAMGSPEGCEEAEGMWPMAVSRQVGRAGRRRCWPGRQVAGWMGLACRLASAALSVANLISTAGPAAEQLCGP